MIRPAILTYYAATVLILLAVSGCMTRSSPKVHYYSLLSMEHVITSYSIHYTKLYE